MKYFQKSDIFLIGAAFISFVLSVSLWFYGYKDEGLLDFCKLLLYHLIFDITLFTDKFIFL